MNTRSAPDQLEHASDDPATIRKAARNVLGDSTTGLTIIELCDQHQQTLQLISASRAPDATTIAVIGATGQGKSWLIRQLVNDAGVRRAIPSGNAQAEATRRLYWIGPHPPRDLDARYETYLYCAADAMASLGGPFVLVDTPGANDIDRNTAEAAARAIAMASVLVLVVRRDQVRSDISGRLAEASDGTLILPVITVVRGDNELPELRRDIDDLLGRLRIAAPHAEILAPQLVPDFELPGNDMTKAAAGFTKQITELLSPQLANSNLGGSRKSIRMHAERERFRHRIAEQLDAQLPRLTSAVEHLDQATARLPHDVAVELIGSGQALRAGIRSRLRAEMLVTTWAFWFPYRTLLGLLNLTHGAWDRVILALSGSLPSLVGAAWTSFKNISQTQPGRTDSNAIQAHSAALIADRIHPLLTRFRGELQRVRPHDPAPSETDSPRAPVELSGLDSLQEETRQILDEEIQQAAPSFFFTQLTGFLGTILFWGLLSGPIVSLYRSYFAASYDSLGKLADNLEKFPHPSAAMIFTSLLLSLLPTSLFVMVILTIIQRRGVQERAAENIDQRIKQSIERLRDQGVLRIEYRDPMLEDTRLLIGQRQHPRNQTPS